MLNSDVINALINHKKLMCRRVNSRPRKKEKACLKIEIKVLSLYRRGNSRPRGVKLSCAIFVVIH